MTTTTTSTPTEPLAVPLQAAVTPLDPRDFSYNYGAWVDGLKDKWTPGLLRIVAKELDGHPCLVIVKGLAHLAKLHSVKHGFQGHNLILQSLTDSAHLFGYSTMDIDIIMALPVVDGRNTARVRWDVADAIRNEEAEYRQGFTDALKDDEGRDPYGKVRHTPDVTGWTCHFTPQATADQIERRSDGATYYARPETILKLTAPAAAAAVSFQATEVRAWPVSR